MGEAWNSVAPWKESLPDIRTARAKAQRADVSDVVGTRVRYDCGSKGQEESGRR